MSPTPQQIRARWGALTEEQRTNAANNFGYPDAGREGGVQSQRDEWERLYGERYRELGHEAFCMERRLERIDAGYYDRQKEPRHS